MKLELRCLPGHRALSGAVPIRAAREFRTPCQRFPAVSWWTPPSVRCFSAPRKTRPLSAYALAGPVRVIYSRGNRSCQGNILVYESAVSSGSTGHRSMYPPGARADHRNHHGGSCESAVPSGTQGRSGCTALKKYTGKSKKRAGGLAGSCSATVG